MCVCVPMFIPVLCEEGELRVVGGTANSGRVEVCILDQWQSPCVREWTANNTRVVCRQLGFTSSGTYSHTLFRDLCTLYSLPR